MNHNTKYNLSKKGKITKKKYNKSRKGKRAKKKYQQSEKGKAANKRYAQSKKGKLAYKKARIKRKRGLGFIPLMSNPFPDEVSVEYHHINNVFVVPVPKITHKNMYGKNHRIKVNNWIEQYIGLIGV